MVSERLDVIHMILNAGLMVQFVMLLLFLFSVASWAIILIKYFQIRKAYKESAFFVEYFWKSKDFSDAFSRAKGLEFSPIARAFRIAYLELRKIYTDGFPRENKSDEKQITRDEGVKGFENVKRALHRSSNTESIRLTQMVPFLATTGNTAPFIGLFGTVWGIMNSFHSIAYQKGTASIAAVAPGISEALVATAAGLAVAIPAVIAFNYFTQKIRIIESELDSFSSDFLNIIERELIISREV
ncbi:MAG: protein TolQ [Desulfobacteraceae bacterium]|nr:protein TolQ [Desulfobacteraceae bacterium]MBC2754144.1 protein TolQ [Desulfobacteraceae bacterium]